MGFFDGLFEVGKVVGTYGYYYSKYKEYDDLELVAAFYEYVKKYYNGYADEEDLIKLNALEAVVKLREYQWESEY